MSVVIDVDVAWLDADERGTWMVLLALTSLLPAAVDSNLQRESRLTLFDYTVLAMLSESEDRTLRMSQLAAAANGSLSRLSHVARRLEGRGFLRRSPLPGDGRITVATITDEGYAALVAAAPAHVADVRRLVFDALSGADVRELRRIGMSILSAVDADAATAVQDVLGCQPGP